MWKLRWMTLVLSTVIPAGASAEIGVMFVGLTLMTAPVGGAFNFARFLGGWIGNMWAASTYASWPPEPPATCPDGLC